MIRQTFSTTATLLLAACLASGCALLESDSGGKAGARKGAARDIPADAKLVASGQPPLSFMFPPGGGRVYLYDQSNDSLLHTADLGAGDGDEEVSGGLLILDRDRKVFAGRDANADPKDDVILVTDIDPNHRYAIYYQAPQTKAEPDGEESNEADAAGPTTRPAAPRQ